MSRYIDADELRSFIKDQYFKCDMPEEWGNGVMWATSQINHYCNKVAPSIDIVRCKECKWFDADENESDSWHLCTRHFGMYINFAEDDYCSYGERKE